MANYVTVGNAPMSKNRFTEIQCLWLPREDPKIEILLVRGRVEDTNCPYLSELECTSPSRFENRTQCYVLGTRRL